MILIGIIIGFALVAFCVIFLLLHEVGALVVLQDEKDEAEH